MKLIPIQIALAAAMALSGAASAQTAAAPASPWSFNVALTTNYKFRGQDQDTSRTRSFKPALQGGIDYAFSNGFYLGNWNSTVSFVDPVNATRRANLEMDFYGGYKWSVGDWGFTPTPPRPTRLKPTSAQAGALSPQNTPTPSPRATSAPALALQAT